MRDGEGEGGARGRGGGAARVVRVRARGGAGERGAERRLLGPFGAVGLGESGRGQGAQAPVQVRPAAAARAAELHAEAGATGKRGQSVFWPATSRAHVLGARIGFPRGKGGAGAGARF